MTDFSAPLTVRQYAYVSITGPGQHEDVTRALAIDPTEAWNVGDVNPRDGRPRRTTAWILASGLDDTHALEEHVRELFVILGTREHELRNLWVDYDLTLSCVSHFPSWTHGAHFDREVVRQAARLGFAIDLDFYFLDEARLHHRAPATSPTDTDPRGQR